MKQRGKCVFSYALSVLCVLAILASLGVSSSGFAAPTATITGRITDLNNAVIPRAKVVGTNIDTNVNYPTETNNEGIYVLANLPPGRYRIFVSKEGFKTIVHRETDLHVQDVLSLSFMMELGSIDQSITVDGDASLILRETATVGTLVNRQFVENLPLNGRSFQSLIALTPGTVVTKADSNEQGQFSVNGQRANANYFTIDGVSANAGVSAGFSPGQASGGATPLLSAAGGTNNLVSVDAMQEFKIQTSTFSPEFGRTPGAQIQIVTRSGTNQFRGTLFEYFRNDVFDANDWFANANGLKKPALRQNDFGGVMGGPIIKNRTFFFGSYEGLRLRQPQVGITDVPSIASRAAAVPQIRPFLDAYPIPNGPVVGTRGFAKFSASFSNPSTLDHASVRIDHTLNEKLILFGRYNFAPSENIQRGGLDAPLSAQSTTNIKTQALTMGATWVVTPKISNELRANYSRSRASNFYQLSDFGGAQPLSDTSLFPSPYTFRDSFLVLILLGGSHSFLQVGHLSSNLQRQVNFVDNLSVVTGAHQFKFGADYRRLSPFYDVRKYFQQANFTGVSGTTRSAITGLASSATNTTSEPNTLFINNFSIYGQDAWKLSQRLTLTYGIRWELNPPPSGDKPLVTVRGLDNPAQADLAPLGSALYETEYGNVAPRIGAAYLLSRKTGWETLLRGGVGVFYDLGFGSLGNAVTSFPYVRRRTLPSGTNFPLSASNATPLPFDLNQRFVGQVTVADPNLKLPRVYQWNLALSQSLGNPQMISATYIGAVGRRLLRQEDLFSPNSKFSEIRVTRNSATSDYHALQIQFQRRLSKGLQAQSSYTWAKSIDITSNDSFQGNPPIFRYDPKLDRGPSSFDIRHAFNIAMSYNIPAPAFGRLGNAILGNWSVDALFTARSAPPVDVTYFASLPDIGSFELRPDLVPGIPLYVNDPTVPGGRRFNNTPAGPFLIPAEERQGTLGRNSLRGFPFSQADMALRRQFKLREHLNLQFRFEFFNIFNHPNFADPLADDPEDPSFGISQSMLGRSLGSGGVNGGFNPLYQIGGPRSVQLALRLQF